MYHLYDIAGYTFDNQSKNFIGYNNFDLIIIYENLFTRFIVNSIAISTNNKSYYRLQKFAGNPY